MTIEDAWQAILEKFHTESPGILADLNDGCEPDQIVSLQERLHITLPESLKELYLLNDGQKGVETGVYFGCTFLALACAEQLYNEFVEDEGFDVFSADLFPFAFDGFYDVYCIDVGSGAIYFMWTGGPDIFLPREWQTTKRKVAEDMEELLGKVLEADGGSA